MNYIKQLQQDKLELQNRIDEAGNEIQNLLEYLASAKFQGFENNYVNAQEMQGRVLALRNILN